MADQRPTGRLILGYQDRSRIIDDPHLGLSVAGQRAVLIDGRVAATWTTGDRRLTISLLRNLTRTEERELEAEGQNLATFMDQGIDTIHIAEST
ncbi:DNA glycosylase AlkZ-like family protein [Streptomyces celluloflavus]|uniref:DNA glycosylase AlkZ-like family protein n=1 Tax=Streptomyces celluloflavus TaxID=58344 RepID=UPI0036C510D3